MIIFLTARPSHESYSTMSPALSIEENEAEPRMSVLCDPISIHAINFCFLFLDCGQVRDVRRIVNGPDSSVEFFPRSREERRTERRNDVSAVNKEVVRTVRGCDEATWSTGIK